MHQKVEVIVIGYDNIIISKAVGTTTEFVHLTLWNLDANQDIGTSFTLLEGKFKNTISGLVRGKIPTILPSRKNINYEREAFACQPALCNGTS